MYNIINSDETGDIAGHNTNGNNARDVKVLCVVDSLESRLINGCLGWRL